MTEPFGSGAANPFTIEGDTDGATYWNRENRVAPVNAEYVP
jgi:hypothetical protein